MRSMLLIEHFIYNINHSTFRNNFINHTHTSYSELWIFLPKYAKINTPMNSIIVTCEIISLNEFYAEIDKKSPILGDFN